MIYNRETTQALNSDFASISSLVSSEKFSIRIILTSTLFPSLPQWVYYTAISMLRMSQILHLQPFSARKPILVYACLDIFCFWFLCFVYTFEIRDMYKQLVNAELTTIVSAKSSAKRSAILPSRRSLQRFLLR